jgi:hypothetical protein
MGMHAEVIRVEKMSTISIGFQTKKSRYLFFSAELLMELFQVSLSRESPINQHISHEDSPNISPLISSKPINGCSPIVPQSSAHDAISR